MKLFIFFSLVFLLIPFAFGQEQKREELQAVINEAIIPQEIIRLGLPKPDGIHTIVTFRQAQCDFNLLVTL